MVKYWSKLRQEDSGILARRVAFGSMPNVTLSKTTKADLSTA
jgi:hypothetical protein